MTENIIWLTLDSVRQDHTTMGGYERETTPNIQAIADRSDGVAFSSCFSHGNGSSQSIPSILSGTYPSRHDTYYSGQNAFPDDLPLVSELFGAVGYQTVGVSNNAYASSLTSVDRGFDRYTLLGSTPMEILRSVGPLNLLQYVANIRRHSAGFTTDFNAHSGAYLLTKMIKQELREAEEPVFLYAHYNEPHRAYYPPLPYLDRYTDDLPMSGQEAAEIAMDIHVNIVERIANGCDLTEEERQALIAMYDAEIAYTDEMVGRVYETIQQELDDTIVIITADHGELFGEDDSLAHKYSMHNAVLNVPMVVQGLDGLTDEGLVQHSDIVKTLLDVVGADTETVQGVDLREERREYAISQSPATSLDPLLEHNPDFDRSKFPTEPYSVIQDEAYKYLKRPDSPKLYRLPDETTDRSDDDSDIAEELDTRLTEWLETEGVPVGAGEAVDVDDDIRSRLSDLGYLDHEI